MIPAINEIRMIFTAAINNEVELWDTLSVIFTSKTIPKKLKAIHNPSITQPGDSANA